MKQIYLYLNDYIKKDFNIFTYGITAVFLTICFIINYKFDFEHKILGKTFGTASGFVYYSLFYLFAYFAVMLPVIFIKKKKNILVNYKFWIKTTVFVSLIGIAGAFYYYKDILLLFDDPYKQLFVRKMLINSKRMLIYLIPLFIFKIIFDKKIKGLYGLHFGKFNAKPYFYMLIIMFPVIFWASFQADFLDVYPKFKPWVGSEIFNMNTLQRTMLFEFVYGLDFVFVELIFRGALVVGMVSLLGKDVILPMVSVYAFLHFGKPMAEAVGSVFGGYVLGVIALYSRSILGGCIIHIGVAFTMELTANCQYYIFGNH